MITTHRSALFALITALCLAITLGCSGGGGSDSPSPTTETGDPMAKCKAERKAYVTQAVGSDLTVAQLMDTITDKESAPQFWRNLPDCY